MPRAKLKMPEIDKTNWPTQEQLATGDYKSTDVMHVETATAAQAHLSAHSPVERWKRAERLSDSQIAAIALCEELWEQCGLRQKLTANYGERMPIGTDNEWLANTEIGARKRLARIEDYVPAHMWEVWENVVRHGEPSGTAGASLGFEGSKSSQAAVLMLVMNVADIIAREERL